MKKKKEREVGSPEVWGIYCLLKPTCEIISLFFYLHNMSSHPMNNLYIFFKWEHKMNNIQNYDIILPFYKNWEPEFNASITLF